jgi:hypothetical protein
VKGYIRLRARGFGCQHLPARHLHRGSLSRHHPQLLFLINQQCRLPPGDNSSRIVPFLISTAGIDCLYKIRYNKYTQIAARAVRLSLKENERLAAEKRGLTALRYQHWESGKGGEQVEFFSSSRYILTCLANAWGRHGMGRCISTRLLRRRSVYCCGFRTKTRWSHVDRIEMLSRSRVPG